MVINDIPRLIQRQYSYIVEIDINTMVECAKDILLDTLYPFNEEITTIPPRKVSWIYRCVLEQIERKGMTSVTSYRENGIQITFDRSGVSQSLMSELMPMVGI